MEKRLPAFTIMEVTITMLLAAIIIAMTYTAYSIVTRAYDSYHDKNSERAVLIQLDKILRRDFERATMIGRTEREVVFTRADSTVIKYDFNANYITRISMAKDTFLIKATTPSTKFEGNDVNEEVAEPEKSRIDELAFAVYLDGSNLNYHYSKIYSSADLIERRNDAGN